VGDPIWDPFLTRTSVTFHTNDDDKNHDTLVEVFVVLDGETIAYISDQFGRFGEHGDTGPFTLLAKTAPIGLNEVRAASVDLRIIPADGFLSSADTWRFNFLLDLYFADGSHLLSRASNIELSEMYPHQVFAIE
jgi:hypothetical protein